MIDLENLNTIFKATESADSVKDISLVKQEGKVRVAMSLERFQYLLDCENILERMGDLQ